MDAASASWHRGGRVLHTEGVKAKKVCSFTFLETESVKSRCQQGHTHPEALGTIRHGNPSLLRASCSGVCGPVTPASASTFSRPLSLCVSLCLRSPSPFSREDTCHCM